MMESKLADAFASEGFFILRSAIPKDQVAEVLAAAHGAFSDEPWLALHEHPATGDNNEALMDRRIRRFEERLPDRRRPFLSAAIGSVMGGLLGDTPVLMTDAIPFQYSPSRAAKREGGRDPARNTHIHNYSTYDAKPGAIMAWAALEDIDPAAGPMWVAPGSHRFNDGIFDDMLGRDVSLKHELAELRRTGAPYPEWGGLLGRMMPVLTEILEERIVVAGDVRVPILIEAGDILVFDAALSHGTMVPENRGLTRWSILLKYQGRNAGERSWATWLGGAGYQLAYAAVPPAAYEYISVESGMLYAENSATAFKKMFWSKPLREPVNG